MEPQMTPKCQNDCVEKEQRWRHNLHTSDSNTKLQESKEHGTSTKTDILISGKEQLNSSRTYGQLL